jgi:hypothetical protein
LQPVLPLSCPFADALGSRLNPREMASDRGVDRFPKQMERHCRECNSAQLNSGCSSTNVARLCVLRFIRGDPCQSVACVCAPLRHLFGRSTGGVSDAQPMSDSAWLWLSLDHPPESRKTETASKPPFKRLPNPCESATSTADILPASPGVAVPPATAMRHCRYLTGRNVDARSTRVSPAPPDWLLVTGYWLLVTGYWGPADRRKPVKYQT